MKAPLRFGVLLATMPVVGLSACGGDGSSISSGGTTAEGGGATGGTTASGGTTRTGGTGGVGGMTTGGAGGGPGQSFDCTAPEGAIPALKLTSIATGLLRPVFVTAAPGDDERLFIVEQGGIIRLVKGGALQDKPFLDISDRVHQPGGADERGLLGLAFHPDYQQNGRFFVYYTDTNDVSSSGDQNLVEFSRADADTAKSDAGGLGVETKKLFTLADVESNHNGGMLAFSPTDGFLYIGLGDGGGGGDLHGTFGNGQNLASFWGKILRIDVDTEVPPRAYGIPAGNMTAVPAGNPTMGDVLPEIWDYGLRNPWRFSFDPCTSDLYIADVGQSAWEEVDIEPPGMGNRNYGWRLHEGTHEYMVEGYDVSNLTMPVDEYPHATDNGVIGCSISGGVVYRASAIPGLRGTYFYGDYCSGKVWTWRWHPVSGMIQDKTERTEDLQSTGSIVSFGQDNLGNVYVVDIHGTVSRVDPE